MINLLPTQEKEELKLLSIYKRISVIFAYFLLCLVMFSSFLFFLNLYIELKIEEFESHIVVKNQELEAYKFQEFKEEILKVNENLNLIGLHQKDEIVMGSFINRIYEITPDNIFFDSINLEKDSRTIVNPNTEQTEKEIFANVSVSGIAHTREDLYFFKKILESNLYFKEIYFSVNSWTQPKDSKFSVGFEVSYDGLLVN